MYPDSIRFGRWTFRVNDGLGDDEGEGSAWAVWAGLLQVSAVLRLSSPVLPLLGLSLKLE